MRFDVNLEGVEVNLNVKIDGESLDLIRGVFTKLDIIHRNQEKIMATLADIQTEVTAEGAVVDSAMTLLSGLSQQLKDALASNDPAAMQKVIDDIDAQKAALAASVAANTPGAPAGNPQPPIITQA